MANFRKINPYMYQSFSMMYTDLSLNLSGKRYEYSDKASKFEPCPHPFLELPGCICKSHYSNYPDMWLFVTSRSFCPLIFQLWIVAVLYTWDFIWHARNMRVFQEWQFTFQHFLTSLTRWLRIVSVIAKGHIGHSVMDLTILRGLSVQGKPRCAPLFIPIQ